MNAKTLSPEAAAADPVSFKQDASVIGLVGAAHLVSHFSQLLLAPLFPLAERSLQRQLRRTRVSDGGVFCGVVCGANGLGFVVDRFGPRPVLLGGLALLGLSALGFAASTSYWMLVAVSIVAGIGNGVFHPVDYTLLNRKVSGPRLGHAYSVHGITGNLGWALAPAMLVPLAMAFSWRVALVCAAGVAFSVLALLWIKRDKLALPPVAAAHKGGPAAMEGGSFGFMRIPAVWVCFAFSSSTPWP